jgi:Zn-dependent protease with chaperone function
VGEVALRQAILHGAIAAGLVEAVLGSWRIRRADWRIAFWLLALAFPFLVLPAFLLAAPFRADDAFGACWALFSTSRWNAVHLAGVGVDRLVLGLLAFSGILLFLRDLVPFVTEAVRERREDRRGATEPAAGFVALVEQLAHRIGVPAPRLTVLPVDEPVLFARGLRRPALVVSTGVLTGLSEAELRAALVHELAHVRSRDPLAGWLLMIARLIMFWNPVVQLVCRAIVQEMERRADRLAASLTDAPDFATALCALNGRHPVPPAAEGRVRASIAEFASRLHHAHLADRVAALTEPETALPFARTRFALVAVTLTAILFFVV